MRRFLLVALGAGLLVFLAVEPAAAHALLRRSDPVSGALLQTSPPRVVITFTEPPDPSLSFVHVLDESGKDVERGKTEPVPGAPLELRVALPALPDGVYTVTWRTVSETDGHVTGSSFAFGVGVAPTAASAPGGTVLPTTPSPSPLAAIGRWGLYIGLALLLGGAVLGLFVFGGRLPASAWVLGAAWLIGVGGLALMTVAERSTVGVSYATLFRSSAGSQLTRQGIGLAVAGVAVAVAAVRPRVPGLIILGLAAAGAMLMHAQAGHAGSESPVWFNVGVQWLHLLAVGVWVGGLAWLLVGTRASGPSERAGVGRFSFIAGIALAVVAVTGVVRAIDEIGGVGAWRRLFETSFGVTLLIKVALFAGLVALGARNRYVNVPAVAKRGERMRSLRRTVGAEVAIAVGIFGVTGVLTQLPPAAQVAAATRPASMDQVVVTGSDFATSARVRLTIMPGTVGPNHFEARIADYDTGAPLQASSVSLQFSLSSHPDMGTPSLDLSKAATGVWHAEGTILSMPGTWDVTVLIQRPAGSVVVPLKVQTRAPPQSIQVSQAPGQPTLYTISLAGGISLQTYIDPGKPGNDVVHFTFFQASGNEQPIASATATATTPAGHTEDLPLIRFDPGHFVANTRLDAGHWRFSIQATTKEGVALSAYFDQTIAS
jgi:copper transport protein